MIISRTIRQSRSRPRRENILAAALDCFSDTGFEETSIGDIGKRSGASVGSIYHQFGNKAGIAGALYLQGRRDYQAKMAEVITPRISAQTGVTRLITAHLGWVEHNVAMARFLFTMRRAEFMLQYEAEFAALNAEFGKTIGRWAGEKMRSGELRTFTVDLFIALLLGPAQEYVRAYFANRTFVDFRRAQLDLSQAAWRALGQLQ